MKNESTSQSLAEAFAEHRARLLSLVEKRLNPILNKRLSHEDVIQEVYLAAAKRLPYFAQNEDVPIYFKLRTVLLQTLADIERKNLQAAGRDVYREAEVGDDTTSAMQSFARRSFSMVVEKQRRPRTKNAISRENLRSDRFPFLRLHFSFPRGRGRRQ